MATKKTKKKKSSTSSHKRSTSRTTVNGVHKRKSAHRKRRARVNGIGSLKKASMHILLLAGGMFLYGIAKKAVIPQIENMVPMGAKKFVPLAKLAGGGYASMHTKSPIMQGVFLGLMQDGINGSINLVAPRLNMVAGDDYQNVGEIASIGYMAEIGAIENIGGLDNQYVAGEEPQNQPYLPLGFEA